MKHLTFLFLLISSFAFAQKLPVPSPTPTALSPFTFNVKAADSTLWAYSGSTWLWWNILSKYQADKLYMPIGGSGFVPTSRTLTINGTTFDLSANRTWNIGITNITGLSDSLLNKANRNFNNVAVGAIPINRLSANTISGVQLGDNLSALTGGYGITSGGTYTGGTARTFAVDTSVIQTKAGTSGFFMTTNTTQTGLTGNKTSSGIYTLGGLNTPSVGLTNGAFTTTVSGASSNQTIAFPALSGTVPIFASIPVSGGIVGWSGTSGAITNITALPNGTTATTQSAADNSTKVATTAYVDASPSGTVTSVGLLAGTTGTDVNITGSPVTSSGNITLNIPSASPTARGLITTGDQTISGQKVNTGGLKAIPLSAPGVVTITDAGAGSLSAGTYKIGVVAISAEGGEGAFDYAGYYQTATVTIGASHNIGVSWNAVPNAVAYRVYVSDASGGYYIRYFQTTNTNFTISTPPVGLTTAPSLTGHTTGGNLKAGNWYAAVSAVFSNGETVGQVSWTLSPVVNLTTDASSVDVSWSSVTGATGYKVWFWSETEGGMRFGTRYFTNATTSVTVTGNETYITGLEALPKGDIELETSAPVLGSSFVQLGNNKNFFTADVAITAMKGSMAEFIAQRYDDSITPFGYPAFAGLGLRTGGNINWQQGIGSYGNDYIQYNYGVNGISYLIDYETNKYSIYGTIANVNTPTGTGGTDSLVVKKSTGDFARISPSYYATASSLSGYVTTDQTSPQTIGSTGSRLTKLWVTDITATNAITGSVTGNAGTATALATARNIQGVSFDGTANINIINGTGFVKASGTTLSYDNSTYLTSSTGVSSITGTANQITASASTGAVTLSLPQDIATGSTPTFGTLTLSSTTAPALFSTGKTTQANYAQFGNSGSTVKLGQESSSAGTTYTGTIGYATLVGNSSNVPVQIATNGVVRQTIDGSGLVGIGTTSPGNPLHVVGAGSTTYASGDQVKISSGSSGNRAELHFTDGVTSDALISFFPSATGSARFIETSVNGSGGGTKVYGNGVFEITNIGTGAVQATAGVLSVISDGRVKTHLGKFRGSALNAIGKLQAPEYWRYNAKSGMPKEAQAVKQFSLFADKVYDILGEEFAPTQKDGMHSLSDRALLGLAIQAIQELQAEVKALKK